jgi:hypothetical protein
MLLAAGADTEARDTVGCVFLCLRHFCRRETRRSTGPRSGPYHKRSKPDQIAVFRSLVCTGARQNLVTCGAAHSNRNDYLISSRNTCNL